MSSGAEGKTKTRMSGCPVSWKQMDLQRNIERTGQGLSASGGLIQKIYEVDPLTCPKCAGKMKVISVIEAEEVKRQLIAKIRLG